MNPYRTYWMWTTGSFETSITINLDWRKQYLVTGDPAAARTVVFQARQSNPGAGADD